MEIAGHVESMVHASVSRHLAVVRSCTTDRLVVLAHRAKIWRGEIPMQIRALAIVSVLAAAAGMASAQVHVESEDAPALAGGQFTGSGSLSAIRGALDGGLDVDMYQIRVDDWATFSATTRINAELPSPVEDDTQLFLFNSLGIAIAMNDDAAAPYGGFLSTLEAGSPIYSGRTNGEVVWIAISGYDSDPRAAGALDIFADNPFRSLARPATGPGAAGALDSWAGENSTPRGSYRISLTGASAVPTPGALALLGLGGIVAGRRRRN
jgi:MYXO-CTERM domain-containing protein